jgi:hypothetical protein
MKDADVDRKKYNNCNDLSLEVKGCIGLVWYWGKRRFLLKNCNEAVFSTKGNKLLE